MTVVAVTGSSGLLGQAVVAELHQQGYVVWGWDMRAVASPFLDRFQSGDILDSTRFAAWIVGADALVHLAALPSPELGSGDWVTTVNVLGTYRALEAAMAANIRTVVLASSVSALGMAWGRRFMPAYLPIDEDHPLMPEDAYGTSKWINEIHGAMFARRYGASIACLRFPTIVTAESVGPFRQAITQDPELGARLLWAYIDRQDAALACRLALERPRPGCHPYYVTASDHLAGDALPDLLRVYYPAVPRRPDLSLAESLFSIKAAAAEFGYQPAVRWGERP
ncbi:MAG: NAD(P)-dependent oxidoreductase [Firmicutes bacterium]|nr:NAD(P)-dependent oxidoreductase [Bacillota bacterium]